MRSFSNTLVLAIAAGALVACDSAETPEPEVETAPADAGSAEPLNYEPVASVLDLMRGTVTLAAERYWESVMIVWDEDGETIHRPENDLEWQEVWSAGLTLAESGNLLMLPRVGFPQEDEWNEYSRQLREAGVAAAQAALRQDYMEVLEAGNVVYNACVACHEVYVPTLSL